MSWQRENLSLKGNMTRDDDAVGGEVKTPKSLMIRRITQENTEWSEGKVCEGAVADMLG